MLLGEFICYSIIAICLTALVPVFGTAVCIIFYGECPSIYHVMVVGSVFVGIGTFLFKLFDKNYHVELW